MIMQGKGYLFEETEAKEVIVARMKLESKDWEQVRLYDICNISSGKDIYETERIDGDIPYIASTSSNNGVKYFVSNLNNTIERNIISVNRNGSVGYSFYHKYEALYSNDCRKLKLKKYDNEYIALFVANQIYATKRKVQLWLQDGN